LTDTSLSGWCVPVALPGGFRAVSATHPRSRKSLEHQRQEERYGFRWVSEACCMREPMKRHRGDRKMGTHPVKLLSCDTHLEHWPTVLKDYIPQKMHELLDKAPYAVKMFGQVPHYGPDSVCTSVL